MMMTALISRAAIRARVKDLADRFDVGTAASRLASEVVLKRPGLAPPMEERLR